MSKLSQKGVATIKGGLEGGITYCGNPLGKASKIPIIVRGSEGDFYSAELCLIWRIKGLEYW